jgi:hypothetical protein
LVIKRKTHRDNHQGYVPVSNNRPALVHRQQMLLTEFEREDVRQMRFSPSEHLVAVAYGTSIDVFSSHTWTLLATLKVPPLFYYLFTLLNSCFGESLMEGKEGPRASPRVLSMSDPAKKIIFHIQV